MRFIPQLRFTLPASLRDTRHLDEQSRYDLLSNEIPEFILSRNNPLIWQNELRYPYFRRFLSEVRDKKVVDLGCGWGFLSKAFSADGAAVTMFDISFGVLSLARREMVKQSQLVRSVRGQAENLPFLTEKFDIVTATDMLEHVGSVEATVAEAARILKSGGYFGFVTVNKTLMAKLVYIILGERLMNLLPRGTHHYHQFIPPRELIAIMTRYGLDLIDLRGILVNPFLRRYHYWP
jgi:2-polyprenyl-6-hydroxyphenyl methylase/3-demethylubiquinone-9 3-methyltransferase